MGVVGLGRLNNVDAVTLDAYGTLVGLEDPLPRLQAAFGVRAREAARGFEAEFAFYREHVLEGRDAESLAVLRSRCAAVFAEAADAKADSDAFQACLVFIPLPGVVATLRRLRARGLALAVVSNWDVGLHEHLRRLGLAHWFDAVVTSAECGIRKPDPRIFALAIERLRVRPERVLHVGDDDVLDREGAQAAGIHFAPAPLTDVFT